VPRRLVIGFVFVGISLINLVVNLHWLGTGDIHRPNFHSVMRGGWTGFWITTLLYSGLLVIGVVFLFLERRRRRDAQVSRNS
jgi:uncharacterized membrane protein